jgi:hypothetical protein
MAGAGAKPSPGPLLPIPVGHCVGPTLGDHVGPRRLRRRCVLHANTPGGWVGCIGKVDELVVDGVEKK